AAFKVGFTTHPLQRVSAFCARFYERFDLSQSLLLSVAGIARARELELEMKHRLAGYRFEPPAWVPAAAGGRTEWFAFESFSEAKSQLAAYAGRDGASIVEARERLASDFHAMSSQFEPWAWTRAQEITRAWEEAYAGWPAPLEAARS